MATTFLVPKNNASTTINDAGGISDSDTTLVVTDGSVFPLTVEGDFHATIEDEIILVTANAANSLTIERGEESTTPAAHADGVAIKLFPTAEAMTEIHTAINSIENASSKLPLAGGTMVGDIILGENNVQLDHDLGTDHHWSGITITGTAGAALAFGQCCYLDGESANDKWELTDSDAEVTSGDVMIGVCVLAANEDAPTELLLYGFVRDDSRYNFAKAGDALYLENNTDGAPGDFTAAQPVASTQIIRVAGYAHDDAATIFFDPSKTWLELV